MQSHASEIIVQFRKVPHSVFPDIADEFITPNRLVLRLQPDEGVHLHLVAKRPGPGGIRLHPAVLNLSFAETFKAFDQRAASGPPLARCPGDWRGRAGWSLSLPMAQPPTLRRLGLGIDQTIANPQ